MPVITAIALIVTVIWIVVGLEVRGYSGGKAVSNAITYAIAVLAISCPCALGLAVPMVLVVAGGIAARGGVIIKSAQSTATAYGVNHVVFDKAGTLTTGDLEVVAEEYLSLDPSLATSVVSSLLRDNRRPVSLAVTKHLSKKSPPMANLKDVHAVPRADVEATLDGSLFRAGNAHWLGVSAVPEVDRLQEGMTTLCVTQDGTLSAIFGLKSKLRPEAASVVKDLQKRQIEVHIVSGD